MEICFTSKPEAMKIILLVRRGKSDLAEIGNIAVGLIFLKNMNLMVEKALKALQMNLKHFWGRAGFYFVVGFEFSMGWDLIELKDRLREFGDEKLKTWPSVFNYCFAWIHRHGTNEYKAVKKEESVNIYEFFSFY